MGGWGGGGLVFMVFDKDVNRVHLQVVSPSKAVPLSLVLFAAHFLRGCVLLGGLWCYRYIWGRSACLDLLETCRSVQYFG